MGTNINNQDPAEASEKRLYIVRQLWHTYETSRVELAKMLYEEREVHRSAGGCGVSSGFKSWLEKAGIPRATAYRLINEHEGTMKPKHVSPETPSVPEQDDGFEPLMTIRVQFREPKDVGKFLALMDQSFDDHQPFSDFWYPKPFKRLKVHFMKEGFDEAIADFAKRTGKKITKRTRRIEFTSKPR